MSASGTGSRKTKFEPHMAGFLKVFPPTHYRPHFSSWEECNRFAAKAVEDVIVAEDPDTVAGVLLEPIGNTGGIITPTPEYFQILRRVCDRHNVMLIFDEVITFAKTGSMFAAQTFGVTPDILCCGKGLSNGALPVAAMIAREDLADAFWGRAEDDVQFAHGNTFAGNPLACAVGKSVIEEIAANGLDRRGAEIGDRVTARLEALRRYGFVGEVRGRGVLRGVELVKDPVTMEPFPALGNALKRTAIENGLIMRIDPSWFAVAPALTIRESEIDEMCTLIERSFAQAIEIAAAEKSPSAAFCGSAPGT
jgi:adenosylmethionine-8-amino-7-oxononanoate aminotransferase